MNWFSPRSWFSDPAPMSAPKTPVPPLADAAEGKVGGVVAPFNRVMDGDSFLDRHPMPRPMAQSVWVMSAIKMVSEPICAVPLDFVTVGKDGKESPYANPALKTFWEKPVKGLSGEEFISACVGWNKLEGEIFVILDDTWLVSGAKKSLPLLVRPQSMREVVATRDLVGVGKGELIGWVYTDAAGTKHELIPDQVIHQKEWNPYNQFRGLAEMKAAHIAAEADFLQGKFARNLAANNGDQGVFVISTGATPTETQQKQIIEALRMKKIAAMRGELRPIFLSADLKIEDPKIQTPDADFVAQRLENRHEVAIAFRVPPSMFDVVASYSIGSASDRYRLIEDACMPMGMKLVKIINQLSRRYLGDVPLTASFNWSAHSVMMQVRIERVAATKTLWSQGVPMSVCSDYLKLQLPKYAGWEKSYIPFNVTPSDEVTDPTTDPKLSETPLPKDEGDDTKDSTAKLLKKIFEQRDSTKAGDKREALWKSHSAYRAGAMKNYRAKFTRVLMGARGEMLSKLAAHYTGAKTVETKEGAAAYFMFDISTFSGDFKSGMDSAGRSAYEDAGQQVYDELGLEDPWVSPPVDVKRFLAERENKLKDVPQEVWDQIKAQLDEGVDKGESTKDLSARVRSTFNEIGKKRGDTIATTETAAAFGTARQKAMETAGVQFKEWLTSHNKNVRPAHAAAEGQLVAIHEKFTVGGEELSHPGDPAGSPGNVINCHCIALSRAADGKAYTCERSAS